MMTVDMMWQVAMVVQKCYAHGHARLAWLRSPLVLVDAAEDMEPNVVKLLVC